MVIENLDRESHLFNQIEKTTTYLFPINMNRSLLSISFLLHWQSKNLSLSIHAFILTTVDLTQRDDELMHFYQDCLERII